MPISAQDQALLRGRTHIIKPKLNIFPMQVVATATVANTPAQYPIGELNVSNTLHWSLVKPGQLFRITDGNGDIVTYGVVRLAPTSGILYIDGKSRGDAGYARRLLRGIAANNTVSVFSFEPIWSLLSRIYQGKFYKNYDVPYTDQGSAPYPVCNIGKWRQVDADYATGRGQLSFDNSRSFGWFNANIITYQWTIPAGGTFITGTASTSAITIELPAGFHLIYCKITDSRGKSQTSYRPVWVNHPTLYPAVSDRFGMEITTDSQDRSGREMTFRLSGDIPDDLVIPGGAVLFTEEDIYEGGRHLSDNVAINNYAGFLGQETPHYDLVGTKSLELITKAPYKRMSDIPMVSQAIIEKAQPANWTEIANGFGTVDFVTWYILKHHTTFLDSFDFEPLREITNPPRKKNWGLNGGTVTEYLEQMGKMIRGNIGSASDGAIYLRRDPTIEENSFRNALDERITWTEDDIVEPVDIGETVLPTVGQIRAFAFAYGTTEELNAVACMAPGFVQGMGPSKQDEESLLVGDPATAQDKINRIGGHIYAKLNNPTPEIQIKPNRNMDVADPVGMLWHRIDISSALSPHNERLYSRLLVKSIDRSWENNDGAWLKRLTITFEPETYGQPGETYIVDKGGGSVYPPIDPGTDNGPGDGVINIKQLKFISAIDENGNIGITTNGFNWRNIKGDIAGKACDITIDWGCEYIKSGYVSGGMGAWLTALDDNQTTVRLYYTADLLSTAISWQVAAEVDGVYDAGNLIGVSPSVRVLSYAEDPDHILVVYWDTTGTHCFYTLDAAATYSDTIDFNDTGEIDITSRDCYVGADVDTDGTLATSGIAFAGQNYQMLHLEKGDIDGWLFINESPNGNAPYPMIKLKKDLSTGLATKLNKSVQVNQQAIINTSTYSISAPLNCEASTSGQINTFHDNTWITDDPDIESPICSTLIPTDQQPALDYVYFSRQTYGIKCNNQDDVDQGTYHMNVFMEALLDGSWNVDSIDITYFISALAYTAKNYETANLARGGSPYYLTDGAPLHIIIRASSPSGTQFYQEYDIQYRNELYIQLYGSTTYYCLGGVEGGSEKHITFTGLDLKGITKVYVSISTDYVSRKGLETTIMGFDFWETPWHCELGISGITVHGTTTTKDTPRLYKFEDYKTEPATYTNVSPDGIWAPFHHHGLTIDPVISSQVASVDSKTSNNSNNLFSSTNGGTTYTPHGFVNYIGLHRVGNTSLFFGKNKLDIATAGLTPVASIIGDWATTVSKTSQNTFVQAISAATIA